MHGLQISLDTLSQDPLRKSHIIFLDPLLFNRNLEHIRNILRILYSEQIELYYAYIFFRGEFDILDKEFKISSRLLLPNIQLSTNDIKGYKFENIHFAFDDYESSFHGKVKTKHNRILRIIYSINDQHDINLAKLINLLFENKIVYELK